MTEQREPAHDRKVSKALGHTHAVGESLARITQALTNGEPVSLDDAKVLEAAGCWLRRNMVAA